MITVSLVSHGHGIMVERLVRQLLACPEIGRIILTLNLPETVSLTDARLLIVSNTQPYGFGANHNSAFKLSNTEYFCVLNPDIVLESNPFPALLETLQDSKVGLVAPMTTDPGGQSQDSMRYNLSLYGLLKRRLGMNSCAYLLEKGMADIQPEWVAGMFMLFRASSYAGVGGFDERYFMYCEDADICRRLWRQQILIIGNCRASVIHEAQRASHKSLSHLYWHVKSLYRFLCVTK